MTKTVLITGGAGFIGSALIRYLIAETDVEVVNIDKLTYAGRLENLAEVDQSSNLHFAQTDINDREYVAELFEKHQPSLVMHLAAESHVDRSIDGPEDFITTNIVGTYSLLEEARRYFNRLPKVQQNSFRFHHISTDEVYGSLGAAGLFTEQTRYKPNSPYSASKAASDHLVRAWFKTFGLPVVITNCSNNYGPHQFPEKLIPLVIHKAVNGEPIPVYGKGENIRDWLYVEDHARALWKIVNDGTVGEVYNVGGHNEKSNIEVVTFICSTLDALRPKIDGSRYVDQINFVTDRPGHDFRYAIDASKLANELNWRPKETFESGMRKTVEWYLENSRWVKSVSEPNTADRRGSAS